MIFPFRATSNPSLQTHNNKAGSSSLTTTTATKAAVEGEGNAGNNKGYSAVDGEHNPAVSTSNNVKQPVNNESSALAQHDSRVAAMSIRDIRRNQLYLCLIYIGFAVLFALLGLLYYERPYISGIDEENVRLLLQVPWFKGWKVQIVAVKQ